MFNGEKMMFMGLKRKGVLAVDIFPEAETCFAYLYLPKYSSYAKFKQLFEYAIRNALTLEMR